MPFTCPSQSILSMQVDPLPDPCKTHPGCLGNDHSDIEDLTIVMIFYNRHIFITLLKRSLINSDTFRHHPLPAIKTVPNCTAHYSAHFIPVQCQLPSDSRLARFLQPVNHLCHKKGRNPRTCLRPGNRELTHSVLGAPRP